MAELMCEGVKYPLVSEMYNITRSDSEKTINFEGSKGDIIKIVLSQDNYAVVSRNHARLERGNDYWTIREKDGGSTNGTWYSEDNKRTWKQILPGEAKTIRQNDYFLLGGPAKQNGIIFKLHLNFREVFFELVNHFRNNREEVKKMLVRIRHIRREMDKWNSLIWFEELQNKELTELEKLIEVFGEQHPENKDYEYCYNALRHIIYAHVHGNVDVLSGISLESLKVALDHIISLEEEHLRGKEIATSIPKEPVDELVERLNVIKSESKRIELGQEDLIAEMIKGNIGEFKRIGAGITVEQAKNCCSLLCGNASPSSVSADKERILLISFLLSNERTQGEFFIFWLDVSNIESVEEAWTIFHILQLYFNQPNKSDTERIIDKYYRKFVEPYNNRIINIPMGHNIKSLAEDHCDYLIKLVAFALYRIVAQQIIASRKFDLRDWMTWVPLATVHPFSKIITNKIRSYGFSEEDSIEIWKAWLTAIRYEKVIPKGGLKSSVTTANANLLETPRLAATTPEHLFKSGFEPSFANEVKRNFQAMDFYKGEIGLEKLRALFEFCGIANFQRWDPEFLRKQLLAEKIYPQNSSYGVVVYSYRDWNASSEDDSQVLLNLIIKMMLLRSPNDKIRKTYNLRMIECINVDGKNGLFERLDKLHKTTGLATKPEFLIFHAHGTDNFMEFYTQNGIHVNGREFGEIKTRLDENPIIILDSCSTGKGENSIASIISKECSATVYAPSDAAGLVSITPRIDDHGGLLFEIDYGSGTKTNVFVNGILQGAP